MIRWGSVALLLLMAVLLWLTMWHEVLLRIAPFDYP